MREKAWKKKVGAPPNSIKIFPTFLIYLFCFFKMGFFFWPLYAPCWFLFFFFPEKQIFLQNVKKVF